jgi:SAM-dependent methyltransferase
MAHRNIIVPRSTGTHLAVGHATARALLFLAAVSAATVLLAQVPYVRTPDRVVDAMLNVAKVRKEDIVYDLGSGDGRIVIAAAKRFGARGVGIDIDPERVREAGENALAAGVADRVRFIQQDMFEADISEATVVALYLVPDFNMKLRPKLLRELRPGARIVSHNYDMGDWKPTRTVRVGLRRVHYWVVPENRSPENPVQDQAPAPEGAPATRAPPAAACSLVFRADPRHLPPPS